jgi:hypothetical protein
MDYLILGVGKNFYATVGIFLSWARNNPQECRKFTKCRKIPLHTMEAFCFTFSPQDGTERTFELNAILKSFKKFI